jgi:hypothetical protein
MGFGSIGIFDTAHQLLRMIAQLGNASKAR